MFYVGTGSERHVHLGETSLPSILDTLLVSLALFLDGSPAMSDNKYYRSMDTCSSRINGITFCVLQDSISVPLSPPATLSQQ